MTSAPPRIREADIARCWREALAVWDVNTSLSPPERYAGQNQSHWSGAEPLAYIDLTTRQVVMNFELLENIGAAGSLTAVLAHEIGHHLRFPHTLGLAAELELLEQRLIPGLGQSLTNLFFDLQVNEVVGRTLAPALCDVYRGFLRSSGGAEVSALFFFYLAVYEELWGLEPGSLVPPAQQQPMEERHAGCRAEARIFAQTFYDLPDVFLQFVYFCSVFIRYLDRPEAVKYRIPLGGDVPAPGAEDYDPMPGPSPRAARALREAQERGWLVKGEGEREGDPLDTIRRLAHRRGPGKGAAAFREALVERHYRRLVDRYLVDLPGEAPPPEPFLPTTAREWDWGESPRAIDWTATVLTAGPLAVVRPLARELEPDLPEPVQRTLPALEIYLDTSGSMPDPRAALNAMTLAAQILAASALRKQGRVRGVVYSSGKPLISPWLYGEEAARCFLLKYAGAGTSFPFKLMLDFAEETPDVLRVIISDSDFLANAREDGAMSRLRAAVAKSRAMVALLHLPDELAARRELAPALEDARFRLLTVEKLDDFGRMAARLAAALMEA